ncbi:MAG: segregation/condensation protein A [Gammaproteobacteria bacterium]|nr:segregation/condensation protein A [Gammaproteobacteria bacterium]
MGVDTSDDSAPRLVRARRESADTLALVAGEAVRELPTDLYIPPDALEVFLETFEGPLDLLLYLIRRENLDILDVKVAEITQQYMNYVDLMSEMQLELAGEYLVMAAMLAEIKSRMLLPRLAHAEEDEHDPRAELIRRLQEYEQIKLAAEGVAALARLERDIFTAHAEKPELVRQHSDPVVDMKEVLVALANVLKRAEMYERHAVQLEALSVAERMQEILSTVSDATDFVPFAHLFTAEEGRMGVVVTFLALMELIREALLDLVQNQPFAPIYVRAAGE